MFGLAVLDVAIGLVLIYFLLSLICSTLNEIIVRFVGLRARMLEDGLRQLLGDESLTQKVYLHPMNYSFKSHSWLDKLLAFEEKPTYIAARTFTQILLDALLPAQGAGPATYMMTLAEKLPQTSLGAEAQQTLRMMLTEAGSSYERARVNVEQWYDRQMARVSEFYRQQVQVIIFVLATLITVLGNVDSLALAEAFWKDPVLRATAIAAAQEFAKQNPPRKADEVSAQVQQVGAQLQGLDLPLGWNLSFEGPRHVPKNFAEWLAKVAGLSLTIFAASLGAPFWFDALRKLTGARTLVAPPEKKNES